MRIKFRKNLIVFFWVNINFIDIILFRKFFKFLFVSTFGNKRHTWRYFFISIGIYLSLKWTSPICKLCLVYWLWCNQTTRSYPFYKIFFFNLIFFLVWLIIMMHRAGIWNCSDFTGKLRIKIIRIYFYWIIISLNTINEISLIIAF